MENENKELNGTGKKRPDLLTVLCILSFLGSGLTFFSDTILYVFNDEVRQIVEQGDMKSFFGLDVDPDIILQVSPMFFLWQAIFSGVAFFGVVLMWRLNKTGFHLYTIAQIALLTIPKLFFPGLPFPWFELSLSFLFVYFYGKVLKVF